MITYKEEWFTDKLISEIDPILKDHWKELANNQEIRPLDPDYPKYKMMSQMNILKVFCVRDEGKLIGYAAFFVGNHPHYKNWKFAIADVYYLLPQYRKLGVGQEMFVQIENWLKGLGAKIVHIQDKINHSHEKLFTSLGYTVVEKIYEKVL